MAQLAQLDADDTATWIHTDEVGSVRTRTDDQGTLVGTFAFDAYGQPTGHTGPAATRIGFGGNYTDPGSRLQYLLARVYDPATAQFLTVDPVVLSTKQPYAFAASDPLTYGDPTGLDVAEAGHGWCNVGEGMTTVPEGTTVTFHTPAGWGMEDQLGNQVEQTGSSRYQERYGPGSVIPNYLLSPPGGLNVRTTSRTVKSLTLLSSLLQPYQGKVHWAACRSTDWRRASGSRILGDAHYDPWMGQLGHDGRDRPSDRRQASGMGWTLESMPMFGDSLLNVDSSARQYRQIRSDPGIPTLDS